MTAFSQKYAALSEFLDEPPVWRKDWKWLLAISLLGYGVTLAIRLMDMGNWAGPSLMAGGERLMATHDSYGWLAGAKGVGNFTQFGMSALARFLSAVFGAPLWKVGFWTPAFLGSFVAVGTALWGWLLGGRRAAIAAGFLGALAPGFYYRSRLGYYDSDPFTLLMPLLIGFMLAHLLSFCCTRGWLATPQERQEGEPLPAALPWLALGYGLVARVAHFAHDDIRVIGIALFWIAVILAAATGRPGRRLDALKLLVVYALAAYGGKHFWGLTVFYMRPVDLAVFAATVGLVVLLWRRPERLRPLLDHPWVWLAALLVLAVFGNMVEPFGPFAAKVMNYLKPLADVAQPGGGAAAGVGEVSGPIYPGITQSIREAKNVLDWKTFFVGVSMSSWTGVLGGLGLVFILALRPAFLLTLPLTVLGVCSLFMGVRFAMFGAPSFALGLGLGVHWLAKAILDRTGARENVLTLVQIILTGVCLLGYTVIYRDLPPTPVLAPAHAEALMRLKTFAPKNASVWTWWDYGYATQYYAERMTPTDGGRHAGRDIYPTALALMTPSARQAAQVINMSAGLDQDPARRWDKQSAQEVQQSLALLATSDQPMKRPPTQYLVVCWETMNLLHWMGFYGTWDVVAGNGTFARTQAIDEAFTVDQNRGVMLFRAGSQPIPVRGVDMLTEGGARHASFPVNPGAPHLIINDVAKSVKLMDDEAYNSMAVQLLIGDPNRAEVASYFKLVHEGFPLVRIYEVLPPAQEPQGQAEAFTQ
ncbi:MAG: STT3 domain-containing protein [Humidesulfovibrio sp.]|nr:STT3 domain-containing protein [Humidesulfovibrio sp.]